MSSERLTRNRVERLKKECKEHRKTVFLYLFLRATIMAILIYSIVNQSYETAFTCGLALLAFLLPQFIEMNYYIHVPNTLEVILILFVYASLIMGEIGSFYQKIPLWDTALHTTNGFVMAAVGLSLVNLLNRSKKFTFKLSPLYVAMVAFCFSMTTGVLWEFFEYAMDTYVGTDMQKDFVIHTIHSAQLDSNGTGVITLSNIQTTRVNGEVLPIDGYLDIGLNDTMKDLFVNFIGAVVLSIFGYLYLTVTGEKHQWIGNLMPTWMDEEQKKEVEKIKGPILPSRVHKKKKKEQNDQILHLTDPE
jgi:hypothetical protein